MLLAGCGGDDTTSSAPAQSPQSASTSAANTVRIDNFKFVPATTTVKAGARVGVTNDDSTAHTLTADDGKSFDTGSIDPGSSATVSVNKAARYPYHCTIHSFMHGTLVVK